MPIDPEQEDASRRAYLGVTRATLVQSDDDKKLQEVTIRARFGEQWTNIENWLPYGFTAVPVEPDKDGEAEVLVSYLGGSPDYPIVIGITDRRFRLKGLKNGDVAQFDHRGSKTVLHKDGVTHTSPRTIQHDVVDGEGKVLSSVVQHAGGSKITMSTKDGATAVLDGPNLRFKAGSGGTHSFDGSVDVKGSVNATEQVVGASVLSGGLPVQTA